ncbi:uncharacterized protein LOC112050380 [Bicyclus anynana]|uniref:Uncharacterized protein LOC112050380 n=1 Tax=Bicyclus anynana TaxID=110368 RepID=A0ABM3LIB4_BICAN|nr:uncharacterized protein LOC112050380 [Bicyclus anynana]
MSANPTETSPISESFKHEEDIPKGDTKHIEINVIKNYDSEINPLFRTKRSIDELDKEEEETKKELEITTTKEVLNFTKDKEDKASIIIRNEELLHLALHNILLQENSAELGNIRTQRLKRQIKIQYLNNATTSKIKSMHERKKKDDDYLYIEIETHFDGKGIIGERKKKLVRNLIDKIQKALRSDIEKKHSSVEHIKFVKRTQDPIAKQNEISPAKKDFVEHRQLDPIGKTSEALENIVDRHGNTWKKEYKGPNFLSMSKSVNSAEMNELNIDYDQVMKKSGFSKRLQKPLNTETDNDDVTGLLDSDSNNVTFFLKNIAGSGFSIGFNQYRGEPPDKESMKMFNGIENLIREYHRTYNQANNMSSKPTSNAEHNFVETGHEIEKRNVENLHNIYKRSISQLG